MYTTQNDQPTAEVTFKKSRLKKYEGNKIYLKDGQEFEIELFNPTTNDILGKISIDGKELSGGGIVLRPGERVFLDRYLDKAQKFKFSTYEVGNSTAVQNAIRDNGKVKVTFHKEYVYVPFNSGITWNTNNPNYYGAGTYTSPNFFTTTSGASGISGGSGCVGSTSNYCSSTSLVNCSSTMDSLSFASQEEPKETSKKETGRIEAGSKSNQELVHVNKNFDYWAFSTSEYQILPESVKTYTTSDIRVYCTGCGKKANKSDKFCSACGQKI
jgi:hypothetical protein